jgi:ribosomal protein S12 methylthiotransferase
MSEKRHISIIPLGCPKNDVDSELIAGAFKDAGYSVGWNTLKGDAAVINTCGFVKDAIDESLDAIMEAIEAKKQGYVKRVIVTGCLAQRFGKQLASQLKEVDLFVGVNGFENIPSLMNRRVQKTLISDVPYTAYPENLTRVAYKHPHSVYLKIADGCNNRCSYCVIPYIKGKLKSRNTQDIVKEAKVLANNGAVELNIIAQDTMNFGLDRGKNELIALLSELEKIEGIKWIRLNYLYPSHITNDFLSFISDSEKIVKYFDVPIQHISDRILKSMNRSTTSDDIKRLLDTLNKKIQNPFLRTTIIVGFPGETDDDFNELIEFFNNYCFHRIGVFRYSNEEPAPASRFKNQVPEKVAVERFNRLNEFVNEQMFNLSTDFVNKTYEALIDGVDPDDPSITIARPWFFAPEIDGYIMIYPESYNGKTGITKYTHKVPKSKGMLSTVSETSSSNLVTGTFKLIKITDAMGVDLIGEVV